MSECAHWRATYISNDTVVAKSCPDCDGQWTNRRCVANKANGERCRGWWQDAETPYCIYHGPPSTQCTGTTVTGAKCRARICTDDPESARCSRHASQ